MYKIFHLRDDPVLKSIFIFRTLTPNDGTTLAHGGTTYLVNEPRWKGRQRAFYVMKSTLKNTRLEGKEIRYVVMDRIFFLPGRHIRFLGNVSNRFISTMICKWIEVKKSFVGFEISPFFFSFLGQFFFQTKASFWL